MLEMCAEMQKLRDELDARDIEWSDMSDIVSDAEIEAEFKVSNYVLNRDFLTQLSIVLIL